ncbi:MAG: hypothetical protein Q9191_002778 [Dirinaria sp. TL-2023a]
MSRSSVEMNMRESVIVALAESLRMQYIELRKQPPNSPNTERLENSIRNSTNSLNTELNGYFAFMSPERQVDAVLWRSGQRWEGAGSFSCFLHRWQ